MKKTAERGIKSLGGGRYQIRIYVDGRDYVRTIEATSVRAAARKRDKERAKLQRERVTLSSVAASWLRRKEQAKRADGSPRLAPTTLARYRNAVNVWIVPILGDFIAADLTPEVIRDWRDAIAEERAAASVNGDLRTLRLILSSIGSDAAKRVERLPEDDCRQTDDQPNLLTAVDLARFLGAARELYPQHFPLILFLATTGCRVSTARAVRWEDLDPELGVVHLRRRLSLAETLPGVKRGRTKKDTPPLLPEVYAVLKAHRATFNAKQASSGLVFPSARTGGPVSREALKKPFPKIRKAAGIDRRFTPHGLRRSAALAYRLAGSQRLAKVVLGHTTDAMHELYAPEQASERMQAAKRAFAFVQTRNETGT